MSLNTKKRMKSQGEEENNFDGVKYLNIIFMGTPDFAVPTLETLIEKHNVVAVFTQPDKKKGRGQKLSPPPIKELAVKHNIEVFQPSTLRNEQIIEQIKAINPDMIVVVAFGKMLPKAILDIPKYGCINVHASLLPKYRGAGPIQWSILNGESKTGVTTMYMAEGLDTGDMLLKTVTDIEENETASQLHDRLSLMGAPLLIETIEQIEKGTIKPIQQDDTLSSYAPMLSKELSLINFDLNSRNVHNLIRGLSEWPCAITTVGGKKLKVYKSRIVNDYNSTIVGELLSQKDFIVGCGGNTAIKFTEVQYEGSKRMSGSDFLRGHRLEIETKIGF